MDRYKKKTERNTEDTEKLLELCAKDCVSAAMRVIPCIILFEIIMIIVQRVNLSSEYTAGADGIWYLSGYLLLLYASVFYMIHLHFIKQNPKMIRIATTIYCIVLDVWALLLVYLDAGHQLESVLIYASAISLVPMLCMIESRYVLIAEILSDFVMLFLGMYFYENAGAFVVNFIVFAVITLVIGISYRRIRRDSYNRLIELEKLSDLRWQHAYIDEMTGVRNRRAYNEHIAELSQDRESVVTIWIADINGLKKVNDTLGHAAGDELIQGAAACLISGIGNHDKVYRIGGDEFAIIDPDNTDWNVVERQIRMACEAWKGCLIDVLSISTGYARGNGNDENGLMSLEIEADRMMYVNKQQYYAGRQA